jgi:hypothetical protein
VDGADTASTSTGELRCRAGIDEHAAEGKMASSKISRVFLLPKKSVDKVSSFVELVPCQTIYFVF